MRDTIRVQVEVTCHQRKIIHRLVGSQVKSIWVSIYQHGDCVLSSRIQTFILHMGPSEGISIPGIPS